MGFIFFMEHNIVRITCWGGKNTLFLWQHSSVFLSGTGIFRETYGVPQDFNHGAEPFCSKLSSSKRTTSGGGIRAFVCLRYDFKVSCKGRGPEERCCSKMAHDPKIHLSKNFHLYVRWSWIWQSNLTETSQHLFNNNYSINLIKR